MNGFVLIGTIVWSIACVNAAAAVLRTDTSVVDVWAETSPEDRAIRDRLVSLYTAVHARDWAAVYDFRTEVFRGAVDKDVFVKAAASATFVFDGYDVLDYRTYRLGGVDLRKRLIIRFHQGRRSTYDVIWWRLEDGVWRVDNIGISGIPLGSAIVGGNLE